MHKILIVDDIPTNRKALELILSEIEEVEIHEACNGLEAVEMAKIIQPEIIFMDIMMPSLDGIKATKIIKEEASPRSIVFAVTALEDEQTKEQMIVAGADDFVTKPINDDEILLRTKNYLSLYEAAKDKNRTRYRSNISLFDDPTLNNIRAVIHIDNVGDLSRLGDFFEKHPHYPKAAFNDVVSLIVTIGTVLFKSRRLVPFDIILERGDNKGYVTIWNRTVLLTTQKYIEKFSSSYNFRTQADKITFCIPIELHAKEELAAPAAQPSETFSATTRAEPVVFDFIDSDDLEELFVSIKDLNSLLLIFGTNNLSENDIFDINSNILRIGKILQFYNETGKISASLLDLSNKINQNAAGFVERSSEIAALFQGFGADLEEWANMAFRSGIEDIHAYDVQFQSNVELIANFATGERVEETGDLDDIFDF